MNKKSIIKNIISFGIVDFIGVAIPIITMPILTRSIGLELYGVYLLFTTILTFGFTVIDYVVHYVGVRSVAKTSENKKKTILKYINFQQIRLILLMVYILCVAAYCSIYQRAYFYLFVGNGAIYLLGYFFSSPWFFQAINKVSLLAISSLISRLCSLVFILFFIKNESDFFVLFYVSSVPVLIAGLGMRYLLFCNYGIGIMGRFKLHTILSYFKNGYGVFIGILAPNFYNAIPVMYLAGVSNQQEFAKFAIAMRVCGLIYIIQNVYSKAIYPFLSRSKINYVKTLLLVNGFFSCSVAIFLALFGQNILEFILNIDYSDGGFYLNTLLISMIFVGAANSYSQGFFLPRGFDYIFRDVSVIVSSISGISCFFLIYLYGVIGAVGGIFFARLLFFIFYGFNYFKLTNRFI
ncbi:oligosaccharide flippase family protein [Symbiopectobacterium purcellii]|uniref:Putative O-antigen transporter n=1 Tax=Symbiopectobacterium purcellii TaxID=2871826 RepID=A0ABX9APH2_9ENTR|nr:oligosaccharide flippase family protein [Symbiopectobacterium purcellii]QZN97072.1 oligosaccharide flippase family protein [Symbiopectobacterium purcellii]